MGLPVSLILIAAGAILAWGVTDEPSGLDLDAIGVILIVIGIVGFVLTLLLWQSWWGPGYFNRATYVEGGPARRWYYGGSYARRRTTYVEDEAPPPPGGPPPPP
ncbi:MAG: hypothetical protein AABM30_07305 [Actinomycetota bacterium]